jgi:hypothetical protein
MGKRTRSVTLARSSLSWISYSRPARRMMWRTRRGRRMSHPSIRARELDIIENGANWLEIRAPSDGCSRKIANS